MTRKEAEDINSKIINCFNTKAVSKCIGCDKCEFYVTHDEWEEAVNILMPGFLETYNKYDQSKRIHLF